MSEFVSLEERRGTLYQNCRDVLLFVFGAVSCMDPGVRCCLGLGVVTTLLLGVNSSIKTRIDCEKQNASTGERGFVPVYASEMVLVMTSCVITSLWPITTVISSRS